MGKEIPNRQKKRVMPPRPVPGRETTERIPERERKQAEEEKTGKRKRRRAGTGSLLLCLGLLLASCGGGQGPPAGDEASGGMGAAFPQLDAGSVSAFAGLALKGIGQEFPNKLDHVMNDAGEVRRPAALHPVFSGSFDWHSSVHGHWLLVRLLKLFPDLPEAVRIRGTLDAHLTAGNVRTEVDYLNQPNRASFERTYGWAWLLKLAEELRTWDDPDARRWSTALQPLADAFVARYLDFLPRQTYPIRRGVHPNTAFGIAFALDYARAAGRTDLEALLLERARTYFADDADYPAAWEPDGDDFFSRSLIEADLMHRVLDPAAFADWFHRFLPDLERGEPRSLLEPADVSDRTDPKIVHLDGLNLSRAWCMRGIAEALPDGDPVRRVLLDSSVRHAEATLPHIVSGHYEGEHWLASFAVYLLSR